MYVSRISIAKKIKQQLAADDDDDGNDYDNSDNNDNNDNMTDL
jgi:hypothetical protein